jgi:hypothetical protein
MNSEQRQLIAISCKLFLLFSALAARATEDQPALRLFDSFSTRPLFERARYEIALNNGVLFSPFVATRNRPSINYTITELQFGYMLTDVKEAGWLRGNFEILADGFGSGVLKGIGTYAVGATTWLRYNFVPPRCRLAPYAQAGAGFVLTDIDRRVVGQEFNFNLDLAVGLRYFIRPDWSVGLEYRYQHISNADLGRHNIGVNAHGPVLGVSYFF